MTATARSGTGTPTPTRRASASRRSARSGRRSTWARHEYAPRITISELVAGAAAELTLSTTNVTPGAGNDGILIYFGGSLLATPLSTCTGIVPEGFYALEVDVATTVGFTEPTVPGNPNEVLDPIVIPFTMPAGFEGTTSYLQVIAGSALCNSLISNLLEIRVPN